MKVCSFEGCGKKSFCQGLCPAHYQQQRRGEELRPLQKQFHGMTEYERLMAKTAVAGPYDCWNWQGARHGEWHGHWRNGSGETELAHRAAWRLMRGEIPKGMFVLHRCDNPACINPSHLFLGNQSDNARDMWQKRRANPGKVIGENHGMSKVTKEIVLEIRASTESGVDLARRYGIAAATIGDIRKRRTWKHI